MKLLLFTALIVSASAASLRGWFPRLLGLEKGSGVNTFHYTRDSDWGTCGPCWKHLHLVGTEGDDRVSLKIINLDYGANKTSIGHRIDIDVSNYGNFDSIEAFETKGRREGTLECASADDTCYSYEAAITAGLEPDGSSDKWSGCIKSADVNGDGELNGQEVTDLESGYYYGCIIRGTRAASGDSVADLTSCADDQCTAAHFDTVTPKNFKCTSCD